MKKEFIINTTDLSFDYGDFPGGTYRDIQFNGFNLEVTNDVINIEPFGDCVEIMENVKTLNDLKQFLTEYKRFITKEVFTELLELIKEAEKDGRIDSLPI